MHLCQKVPYVLVCFQASAAPRSENSDSDEKDAFSGLNAQITILYVNLIISKPENKRTCHFLKTDITSKFLDIQIIYCFELIKQVL
jgi:hypothetical protein